MRRSDTAEEKLAATNAKLEEIMDMMRRKSTTPSRASSPVPPQVEPITPKREISVEPVYIERATAKYIRDKQPVFNGLEFQEDTSSIKEAYVGLYRALTKHFEHVYAVLRPFNRNKDFQSNPNGNVILNELVLNSLPAQLRHKVKDFHGETWRFMAFTDFKQAIFAAASMMEFHGDIISYLHDQRQQEGESVAAFHEVLDMVASAFPIEVQQKPVLLAIFRAYTWPMQDRYLSRHLNPADEADLNLGRLKSRMTSLHQNEVFRLTAQEHWARMQPDYSY